MGRNGKKVLDEMALSLLKTDAELQNLRGTLLSKELELKEMAFKLGIPWEMPPLTLKEFLAHTAVKEFLSVHKFPLAPILLTLCTFSEEVVVSFEMLKKRLSMLGFTFSEQAIYTHLLKARKDEGDLVKEIKVGHLRFDDERRLAFKITSTGRKHAVAYAWLSNAEAISFYLWQGFPGAEEGIIFEEVRGKIIADKNRQGN